MNKENPDFFVDAVPPFDAEAPVEVPEFEDGEAARARDARLLLDLAGVSINAATDYEDYSGINRQHSETPGKAEVIVPDAEGRFVRATHDAATKTARYTTEDGKSVEIPVEDELLLDQVQGYLAGEIHTPPVEE